MDLKSKLNGKNILVTGGAGFIGSNLCEYLLNCGSNVTCLDNFSTGFRENIRGFINNPRFELIEGDIRDLVVCQKACFGQHYVLHHAALGSVPRSIKDPITSNQVNASGFLNMLVAARDNNVKRFVFASSSSVYGDSNELPKIEERIGNPLSPYAVTKRLNETYADIFADCYGLDYVGLRYFNVFGRNQDPNGSYAAVIPRFIKKLINHDSPIINGDGTNSRDFTYIDNVVQINLLAMTTDNSEAVNQIYNTGTGNRITLNELTKLLKDNLLKFDSAVCDIAIEYGPKRKGDIAHSLASIEKAKQLLKYNPVNNISEGLEDTVSYYYNNIAKKSE